MARVTKFFKNPNQVKAWIDLNYAVCQTPTLAEYSQAHGELKLANLAKIQKHCDSLFEYGNQEYLAGGNNQKHCYSWTN